MAKVTTYGFHSPITRELAGYPGYQASKRPKAAPSPYPYLSQGFKPVFPFKQDPYANSTPGYKPQAPAATPAAPAPAAPQPQARPAYDPSVDYQGDPILQRIRKMSQGQRDTAQAAALARKVGLATELGDTGFARELGLDEAQIGAAGANPLSTFAQLGQAEKKSTSALDEALNQSNLYFSGHRGTQLGELAQNFLAQRAGALGQARQGYAGIEGDLLSGLGEADRAEMEAEAAAYGRAVDASRFAWSSGAGAPDGTPPPLLPPGGGGDGGGRPAEPGYVGAADPNGDFPRSQPLTNLLGGGGVTNPDVSPLIAELLRPRKRPDPLLAEILRGGGGRNYQGL